MSLSTACENVIVTRNLCRGTAMDSRGTKALNANQVFPFTLLLTQPIKKPGLLKFIQQVFQYPHQASIVTMMCEAVTMNSVVPPKHAMNVFHDGRQTSSIRTTSSSISRIVFLLQATCSNHSMKLPRFSFFIVTSSSTPVHLNITHGSMKHLLQQHCCAASL